jgi:hypothetical protein
MEKDWLKKLMLDELSMLLLGHLPFSPSNEKFPAVVEYWTDSFLTEIGRIDEEIDFQRITEAFRKARPKLHQWPIPSIVIECMKPRPYTQRLPHDPRQHEDQGDSAISIMTKLLCDLIEGKISKDEFDKQMKGYEQ